MSDAISEGYALDGSYQWANPHGSHGMESIEALEAQGYVKALESPQYPGTWLMVRRETT